MPVRDWIVARRGPIAIVVLVALFLAEGARWIWVYRAGQPFDIDESAYLSVALVDLHGLVAEGFPGYFASANGQGIEAPGVPALAAWVFLLAGPEPWMGMLVPLLMSGVTLVATWLLARRVATDYVAILASALVATTPFFIDFSRAFSFAVPTTCVMTITLLSYSYSKTCSRIGWTIIFGAFLGLIPLFRTMAIVFLPGIALAVVVQVATAPNHRLRRFMWAGFAALISVGVAAIWYWTNWRDVLDYLTSFGYGSSSAEYGSPRSLLSFEMWQGFVLNIIANVYLPFAVLLAASALGMVAATYSWMRGVGWRKALLCITRSGLFPLCVVAATGLFFLATSANRGTGFLLPLIPACMILVAWILVRAFSRRWWVPMVIVAAVGLVSFIPKIDLKSPLADPVTVSLPWLGRVTASNGRGTIQSYESEGGYETEYPALPISRREGAAWVRSVEEGTKREDSANGPGGVVSFGFRHRLYNLSSFQLARLSRGLPAIPTTTIPTSVIAAGRQGYIDWLANGVPGGGGTCALLTSTGTLGEIEPYVDQRELVAAAVELGFEQVGTQRLPGDRSVTFWHRSAACPAG